MSVCSDEKKLKAPGLRRDRLRKGTFWSLRLASDTDQSELCSQNCVFPNIVEGENHVKKKKSKSQGTVPVS